MAMIFFLVLLIACAGSGAVGYAIGKQDRLPNRDRKKLELAEDLINQIQGRAIEGSTLGEHVPTIILDDIQVFNKESRK